MGARAAIGGISGALLGSQIGGGRGQILQGVLGGLLGEEQGTLQRALYRIKKVWNTKFNFITVK